jgi:hypothetical protein
VEEEQHEIIERIEISRASDERLRVVLVIGSFPDAVSQSLGREHEGVEISVLVNIQANPPLLDVQVAALERAQEMIAEQTAAIREAIQLDQT